MRYDLYVVTDEGLSRGKTHAEIAREAVAGGADVIQLRDKTMDSAFGSYTYTDRLCLTA